MLLPSDPVMFAVKSAATGTLTTVVDAEVAPAGTVTKSGSFKLDWSDLRFTFMPAAGAGPFRVTYTLAWLPPWTVPGLTWTI